MVVDDHPLFREGLAALLHDEALALTEATVKSHMKNVMAKLGANDRTHAVMIAIRRGFMDG